MVVEEEEKTKTKKEEVEEREGVEKEAAEEEREVRQACQRFTGVVPLVQEDAVALLVSK